MPADGRLPDVLRHLRILDVGLTLAGPASVLEPIASAYRRFEVEEPAPDDVRFELEAPEALAIAVGGRRVELVPDFDRTLQIYQLFVNHLMDRIGTHAVLHAAALRAPAGAGIILASPSGHGKTSLTLELVHRGLGFLSDDYAPLDLERRQIAPYPRAVGVIAGGRAPIPPSFRRLTEEPATMRLLGKCLLDIGRAVGEQAVAAEPAPLAHVLLLSAELAAAGPAPTWLVLASRIEHARKLDDVFLASAGIEVEERTEQLRLCRWRLRLEHGRGQPTAELVELLESDRVLFAEKHWEARPAFDGRPAAAPVTRREAAELLGRELLNRRGHGRLLARHGSMTALFVALAGALRDATCFRIRVGELNETAELIERLVGAG